MTEPSEGRARAAPSRSVSTTALLFFVLVGCGEDEVGLVPIDLTTQPMFIDAKCIAWDGEAYAVVWFGRNDNDVSDLFFARVSPQGEYAFEPQRIFQGLDEVTTTCELLSVTTGYTLLFEQQSGGVDMLKFSQVGATQGGSAQLATSVYSAGVAQHDDTFALLYSDYIGNGEYEVRLLEEGVEPYTVLQLDTSPKYETTIRWLPAESVYVAMWEDRGTVVFARIDPVAGITLLEGVPAESSQYGPVGLHQTSTGALWTSWMTDGRLEFFPVDSMAMGLWAEPRVLLPGTRAVDPSLSFATSAAGDLVAWRGDHETALPQIYVGFLGLDANPVLAEEQMVTDTAHGFREPHAAAGAEDFAVVYEGAVDGTERVYWARVPPPAAP